MSRTETVTVVFTDLVGSTELARRLGQHGYEVLRQEQHLYHRDRRNPGATGRT